MARNATVILANMCMIEDGTRVRVQDRNEPEWPGITFPGGHVEEGEPFTDAVIREVFEEAGLHISAPRLCGIKDWINDDGSRYMVLLYRTDRFGGTLTSSEEGAVFWVEVNELEHLPLAEGMENMLKVFREEDISEEFFYKENEIWIEVLK